MDVTDIKEDVCSTRKRKTRTVFVEESDDYDSLSEYCPGELESDGSECHDLKTKKKTKVKRTKKCKIREKVSDDESSEFVGKVSKKDKRRTIKKKTRIKKVKERRRKKSRDTNKSLDNDGEGQQTPKKAKKCMNLGPHSITGHWYIGSGFVKDLTNLFKTFDDVNSWRFDAFAKCWVKCKFSLVYRGRYTFKEMLEFTEEALFWTKQFLSCNHSMKWRIGAMYALYGLYYKHPFREHCKIRMDLTQYENLMNLARSFQSSADNPDPAYIFFKLTADGAFYHVATPDEMGLKMYPIERQQEIMKYEMQCILEEHSGINLYPEHDRISQRQLLEEYEKVKSQTMEDGSVPEKGMSYVQSNFLSDVDAILAELCEDNIKPTCTQSQVTNDGGDASNESPFGEISEIGRRKLEVYKKAASLDNTEGFLQRKFLRSPQKGYKTAADTPENGPDDSDTSEFFVVDNDGNKARKLQKIMEFMQIPKEDLNIPTKYLRNEKPLKLENNLPNISDFSSDDYSETNDHLSKGSPNKKSTEVDASRKENTSIQTSGGMKDKVMKSVPHKSAEHVQSSPVKRKKKLQPKANVRRGRRACRTGKNKLGKPVSDEPSSQTNQMTKTSLRSQESVENEESGRIEDRSGASKLKECVRKGAPRKHHAKNTQMRTCISSEESVESKESKRTGGRSKGSKLKELVRTGRRRKNHTETTEIHEPNVNLSSLRERENVVMIEDELENTSDEHLTGGASKSNEQTKPHVNKETAHITPTKTRNQSKKVNTSKQRLIMEVRSDNSEEVSPLCEPENKGRTNEHVDKKVCDNPLILNRNVSDVYSDDFEGGGSISSLYKRVGSDGASSGAINDLENTVNVLQRSCSDVDHVEKTLQVQIIPIVPQKKNLQSALKTKNMTCIKVLFYENHALIHSLKFKMSKKDLQILQGNKERLCGLKKKLRASLPLQYKNYELQLELIIDESLMEGSEICEKKYCSVEFESLTQTRFKDNNSWEGNEKRSELVSENSCGENVESSSECSKQICDSTLSNTNTPGDDEPLTSCTDVRKDIADVTEGSSNDIALNSSPETYNDEVNITKNIIDVKMLAHFKEGSSDNGNFKAKNKAYISVDFQVEGVRIHFVKFWILRKDLEKLQNDKKRLESMKAKFSSVLPLQYKNHEMRLELSVIESVSGEGKSAVEDSRQDFDSSVIIPHAPGTLFEACNDIPHVTPSTYLCQNSDKFTCTYERSTSPSKPVVSQILNDQELLECTAADGGNQDQEATCSVSQPIQIVVSSPMQRIFNSNVNYLVEEESPHCDSVKEVKSDIREGKYVEVVPELQTVSNVPEITVHMDHLYSSSSSSTTSSAQHSGEHFDIFRGKGNPAAVKRELMTGDLSEFRPSVSKNTFMEDRNVLQSSSLSPSMSLKENTTEGTTSTTTKSNSVCSFQLFSKRNQCNFPKIRKTSTVKKPSVPFLYMTKLFPKKKH